MPGGQPPDQQQIDQQVHIARRRTSVDANVACELRDIEQAPLVVSEHRPESAQRLCCDARPELWNVALEIRANEVLAPAAADGLGGREETLRKAAAHPEPVRRRLRRQLEHRERRQLEVARSSRPRLPGLAQQLERRRSEQQIEAVPPPLTAGLVNEAPQDRKQARYTLHFVEDDEARELIGEVQLRLAETST